MIWHSEMSRLHPLKPSRPISEIPDNELFDEGSKVFQNFARSLSRQSGTIILDSGLFQSFLLEGFSRNLPFSDLEAFALKLFEILLPIRPGLLYLKPQEGDAHRRRIFSKRGARFTYFLFQWIRESERFRSGHYKDPYNFWTGYQELCDIVFNDTPFPKARLTSLWFKTQPQTTLDLLPPLCRRSCNTPWQPQTDVDFSHLAGQYRCDDRDSLYDIRVDDKILSINGLLDPLEETTVLLPESENRLMARGNDVYLELSGTDIQIKSNWPRIDGLLLKRISQAVK